MMQAFCLGSSGATVGAWRVAGRAACGSTGRTPARVPGPRRTPVARLEAEVTDVLSAGTMNSSPAVTKMQKKYVLPLRDENTQVFFDNSMDTMHTLMVVFADDRHGLVLDVLSIIDQLEDVQCHKYTSSESEAMKFLLPRLEEELLSVQGLGLALDKCSGWFLSDNDGEKIVDRKTLAEISARVTQELNVGSGRPNQVGLRWHRTVLRRMRHDPTLSSISIETLDRDNVLKIITRVLNEGPFPLEVTNAIIKTFGDRIEDLFYVRSRTSGKGLDEEEVEGILTNVVKAAIGGGSRRWAKRSDRTQVWFQYREFWELAVLEAVEITPSFLAEFPSWATEETPSLRGRLLDSPYQRLEVPVDQSARDRVHEIEEEYF